MGLLNRNKDINSNHDDDPEDTTLKVAYAVVVGVMTFKILTGADLFDNNTGQYPFHAIPLTLGGENRIQAGVVPYNIDKCVSLYENQPDAYGVIITENLRDIKLSKGATAEIVVAKKFLSGRVNWDNPAPPGVEYLVKVYGTNDTPYGQNLKKIRSSVDTVVRELCDPAPDSAGMDDGRRGPMKLDYGSVNRAF